MRYYASIYRILFNKPWTFRRLLLMLLYTTGALLLTCTLLILFTSLHKLELWPWYPPVEQWCEKENIPEYMLHSSPDEITVVTMFLDLGIFKKGEQTLAYHSPYKYKRWMRVFGRLVNPVVAYMEKEEDVEYFRSIRSCLPSRLTKIIKIKREELSSFKHLSQIREIYSQPSYPKIHPNTIYPEYTCAMNAKYDVLYKACYSDFYKTRYFAWLDIGLFRRLDGTHYDLFKLVPPTTFDAEKVGFSKAWPFYLNLPVQEIMKEKLVWVSGSMLLATRDKMLKFTKRYKEAVVDLLHQGLSNSDQEVIHSMYSTEMKKDDQVNIQPFTCHQGQFNLWGPNARYFCLGYMCKDAWEERIPHSKFKHKKS